jgi:hypothetical protein
MPELIRNGLLAAAAFTLAACGTGAAPDETAGDTEEEAATIESLTESSDAYEGLFTLFVDRDDGTIRMLIGGDRLGEEFVYFTTVQDAPVASGQFRGNMGVWAKSGVVSIERDFGKVRFVQQNTYFHFDPDSPLSRAADANISPAVLAVTDVLAEDDESGAVLVDAGTLFLDDSFMQLKPSPDPEADPGPKFDLGTLSADKTRFTGWRSYPENAILTVEYVFENPAPVESGGEEVTDDRHVSMSIHHQFVAVEDDGYVPRVYDPRTGYFVSRVTDLTTTAAAPWIDYINRWPLKKKDPGADVSDPVEPIVFWIENTTPLEYRDAVREGTLAWNEAFEQAGFSNAVEVRVQPDDADWDAGDIRYNVIRWTSSPQPPFGGYGPRVVDPRNGKILGVDIMLEQVFMTNRVRYRQVFAAETRSPALQFAHACSIAEQRQMELGLGRSVLRAQGWDAFADLEEDELLHQALVSLALHEVGHTLGLNHNFIGSQMLSPDELYDREITATRNTVSSIMEYAPINIAPEGREQGMYYDVRPGPYDRWVIEFGYSEAVEDPAAERARLEAILARSTEREHWFANDADDMRALGAGIDPRIMVSDMSDDAIRYAEDRIGLIRQTVGGLVDAYAEPGDTYQELVVAYQLLELNLKSQVDTISRYVGGIHVDRSMQGQPGGGDPFRPVALAEQRRAMASLADNVFSADAFGDSDRLYSHLQTQRRDFDFGGTTEDPKIHDQALAIQKGALDHLLHPVVTKRLTDSALYGNEYTVARMITELTAAVFDADMGGDVNSFRQNLQSDYVTRLVAVIAPDNAGGYDQPSRAIALYTLQDLRRRLGAKRAGDLATRAHTAALLHSIDKALKTS